MNQYCTEPGANWNSVTYLQKRLLLEIWDGRDARTGESLGGKTVIRHHYEILGIFGSDIIFMKYDCRLMAQVPLSEDSHGKIKVRDDAKDYAKKFKGIMEKLMRGEWATPDWWLKESKDGEARIKSFEQNLLRLGFVRPNNLDR